VSASRCETMRDDEGCEVGTSCETERDQRSDLTYSESDGLERLLKDSNNEK